MATLQTLSVERIGNGVTATVWRYTTKYSECDDGDSLGNAAKTCPRYGLLISTWLDLEGGSKFALWRVSPRRFWKATPTQSKASIADPYAWVFRLDGCEASAEVDAGLVNPNSGDDWKATAYALKVIAYDHVTLTRLPDNGPARNCYRDVPR